ncbi:MAG: DUF4435 domain-containing protein [Culturomica sp.]|jgi:hypothetical protein|nr:DUF4435 domain-containing protein [Culturomica sp.]
MFGIRPHTPGRETHYAQAARRFALDAKVLRCRAAVHVENRDDILFWGQIFRYFCPKERFHFLSASRNENGQMTSGVTQCLKYYRYLSPAFFICIDSDYRYLQQEKGINVDHFVFQTYTYSFENHHCFSGGLDEICSRVTKEQNNLFDFRKFLSEYSRIIYDLFIWHLYFLNSDPGCFSKYDFNQYINVTACKPAPSIRDNGRRALDELRRKVEGRVRYFVREYPLADLEFIREKYAKLGLNPETAYLFVRGHNVYDMVSCVLKEVCKVLLKNAKERKNTAEAIAGLYREKGSVDTELKQIVKYGAYDAIRLIEKDIFQFFGKQDERVGS